MRNPNFASANARAKFWTPLAQNPGSAPGSLCAYLPRSTNNVSLDAISFLVLYLPVSIRMQMYIRKWIRMWHWTGWECHMLHDGWVKRSWSNCRICSPVKSRGRGVAEDLCNSNHLLAYKYMYIVYSRRAKQRWTMSVNNCKLWAVWFVTPCH